MLEEVKEAVKMFHKRGAVSLTKSVIDYGLRIPDPEYQYRFALQTSKNKWMNSVRYDHPPNPYKTININPHEIEYRVGWKDNLGEDRPLKRVKRGGLGRVKSGDWDMEPYRQHIENVPRIKSVVERFQYRKDWEETDYYSLLLRRCRETKEYKKYGYDSEKSYIDDKLKYYDDLFYDIEANGYQSNHVESTSCLGNDQPIRDRLEVLVTIDRKGKINFFEGNHRFAIARVLELEIPAHVVCRHKQWQITRDTFFNEKEYDSTTGLKSHPDLKQY